jgi:hypothetical protein
MYGKLHIFKSSFGFQELVSFIVGGFTHLPAFTSLFNAWQYTALGFDPVTRQVLITCLLT